MSDPYKILGVSRDASNDEIKKAYRNLSRKYHPDANINAPHPETAEEKFKEIQQAYRQIMDEREHGGSSYSYTSYGRTSYAGSENGSSVKMQAAANFINSRHFKEALNVLNDIPEHDAQWYFFSAIANSGLGNNVTAKQLASQAAALDPSNIQYRQFLQQLEFSSTWYSSVGRAYGQTDMGNRFCLNLCLLNLCCGGCYFPC